MQLGILGSGTYGLVIRARDTSDPDAQDVAIKLLPRGGFVSGASGSTADQLTKRARMMRCQALKPGCVPCRSTGPTLIV